MSIYDRQIAQAKRLIAKKGQLVTWVPQDVTIPDNTKPWKTAPVGSPPTFPVSMVFLSSGKTVIEAQSHLFTGTSVPDGAPKALMGVVPFTPKINDTVLRGSETLTVKSIDTLAPNGDPILYTIYFS